VSGYDAVLFDSDGVLVEPPAYDAQAEATRAAFEEVDVEDVAQQYINDIVDGVTVDTLDEICETYGLDPETFWEVRERHDERSQLTDFETGARSDYDDVEAITDLPQNRGVVSNNHHSTIEFVLDFFGLRSSFDTYYGREKTIESLSLKKPNPHYLNRAIADLAAESVIYVGDRESDVTAANRAGGDSVFIRRPHNSSVNLSVTPTYEVNDLHDVAEIVSES
jgi:phosphoglycolate phosphatase